MSARSEFAHASLFKRGVSALALSELSHDRDRLLTEAEVSMRVYLHNQPTGLFATDAKTIVQAARRAQSDDLLEIARFHDRQARYYRNRGHEKAAEMTYKRIVRDFPRMPAAVDANARLIPASAEEAETP